MLSGFVAGQFVENETLHRTGRCRRPTKTPSTISQADKDSISNWINGESEAYNAEKNSFSETCLNASKRSEVEDQLGEFIKIRDRMNPQSVIKH